MVKICRKCNIEKEMEAFSLHYKSKGGRRNSCKDCEKAAEQVRRGKLLDQVREYDRQRSKTDKRRLHNKENSKKFRKEFPEKYKAHCAVNNALRDGRLVKEACRVCGDVNVHGHHENYSNPLEVVWLCPQHHKDTHKGIYKW